jgi:methionyl-tRNA synthetase
LGRPGSGRPQPELSKTAGNAVDPVALDDEYGTDALRWWLLRDVASVGDTDFTVDRLVRSHDQDLANGLGNLVNRTLTLIFKYRAGRVVPAAIGADVPARIDRALAAFDFRAAAVALFSVVDAGNRLIETERPWELHRDHNDERLDEVLGTLLGLCRLAATELAPFLPAGSARLLAQLDGTARPEPAFKKLRR